MDLATLLLKILACTISIEAVTILLRFGFGMSSTETTSFLRKFTFDLRIHHGYVGLLFFPLTLLLFPGIPWLGWIAAFWLGMFLSDIIHHFLILWPITGSPEFDIFYS